MVDVRSETFDLLQRQIEQVQIEEKQTREQIAALNARLKDLDLTAKQLHSFKAQIIGKKPANVATRAKRGMEHIDEDEKSCSGSTRVDLAGAYGLRSSTTDKSTTFSDNKRHCRSHLPLAPPRTTIGQAIGLNIPPERSEKDEDCSEFLEEAGIIISTGEGHWVELACNICGRNASASGWLRGWKGIRAHLSRAHAPFKFPEDEDEFDFVIRTCTVRQVSVEEVDAIEKGIVCIRKITKANSNEARHILNRENGKALLQCETLNDDSSCSKATEFGIQSLQQVSDLGRVDTNSARDKCNICSRSTGVHGINQLCSICGWIVCGCCFEAGEHSTDNLPIHFCAEAPTDVTSSASTTPAPFNLQKWNETFAANRLSNPLGILDDFCPCTISGHACKAEVCSKKELCVGTYHGLVCANLNHDTKPTCGEFMLKGTCSNGFECAFEHHNLKEHRLAIAMYHDCYAREH